MPILPNSLGQRFRPDTSLLMLCRSGVRSLAAGNAALAAGYQTVINISDGFEGDLDADQQRGHLNGWRCAGLAWRQS
jgi:rhodanese-related sulfurtransferase